MNSKLQNPDFLSERQECNYIYQILGHSAIFNPLVSCVFPNLQAIPNKREERELFLHQPENTQQILDFFKEQENWGLFEAELIGFYQTHKESLKPTEAQRNIVGIAIWAIKKYILHLNKAKPNLSVNDTTDKVKWLQKSFQSLVSKQLPNKEILSDIGWNILKNCESWKKELLFNKEVAKVQGRFIDVETRVPIVIQWKYIITNIIGDNNSFKKVQLYDIVKKHSMERYLKDDFTLLTDNQWNELIEIMEKNPDRLFWKEVKNIKVAKKISEKITESLYKLTDSEFNTLRDEKWNEIIRFYQLKGNAYIIFTIDEDSHKIITFYEKEWNEIKWFFRKLWWSFIYVVGNF